MKGKFKKVYSGKKDKLSILDVVTVGDMVEFDPTDNLMGVIHTIYDRKNYLSRKAPKIKGGSTRGERYEQIIAANVDNLFVITSIKSPEFNHRVLDRILVVAHSCKINPLIIINKADLAEQDELLFWRDFYSEIGYEVFLTSVKNGNGIRELKEKIKNNTNILWGPSGVGKSSILNRMYPFLEFKTGIISEATNKGKHTTVTSVLKEIEKNTFVIDTPGIREIEPYGIKKIDLGHYFPEFSYYINDCKFNTCTHNHEPGCMVKDAVENEKITMERYYSYLNLLDTVEDDMFFNY